MRSGAGKDKAKGSYAVGWLWGRVPEKALFHEEWVAVLGELKKSGCSQVAGMAAVRTVWLSPGAVVAFFLHSQLPPDIAKRVTNCGQESHTSV